MKCNLLKDIKAGCEYNSGGLSHIYLLDIERFQGYEFLSDGLYDESYVEKLFRVVPFIELAIENESRFIESVNNGTYKQELETFVRHIDASRIQWIQKARKKKFVVVFRTRLGRYFVFGSDGGASIIYNGQTGQLSEVNGLVLKIEKNSSYPHFEVDESTVINNDVQSVYQPDFDYAYCSSVNFIPQFDTSYCITQ